MLVKVFCAAEPFQLATYIWAFIKQNTFTPLKYFPFIVDDNQDTGNQGVHFETRGHEING